MSETTYLLSITSTDPKSKAAAERIRKALASLKVDDYVEESSGVFAIDSPAYAVPERDPLEQYPEALPCFKIYHFEEAGLKQLQEQLQAILGTAVLIQLSAMSTTSWQEAWKEQLTPQIVGNFVLLPLWEKAETFPHLKPLWIEAGLAFGTGHHESTRVCLRMCEALAERQPQAFAQYKILDIGTGTAVLALACKKLGASTVHACDIDAMAVQAAAENAERNGELLTLWQESLEPGQCLAQAKRAAPYELVIANMLLCELEKIFIPLQDLLFPRSQLILAGFIREQLPTLESWAEDFGLQITDCLWEADWGSCLLEKL